MQLSLTRLTCSLVAAAAASGSLVLPARAAEPPANGSPAIEITRFAFAPKELTVAPGTTVVFTNRDETPHTVAASDKSFVSKAMDTGDRFEYTFSGEGDFAYFCTLHPFMTGVVHVRK